MRVKPSQLVPGCVLIEEVRGKSNRVIIPEKTVLTDEHIVILEKFLIDTIRVSRKLVKGDPFLLKESEPKVEETRQQKTSFSENYLSIVSEFKKMHENWQHTFVIDIHALRKLILPLYNQVDQLGFEVYTLYKYATKEDYTYHHSVSVGILSAYIARKMGHTMGETLQVGLAGLLSDCGMIKVDKSIRDLPHSLTLQGWEEVKKHPAYAYHLIKDEKTISQATKTAVIQHHERMDGSGYPFGLPSKKIHLYARIIAVCDMFHAMTSERIYREKESPFKVIQLIKSKQFTKLDPGVVQAFIRNLSDILIGEKIKLSNNKIGEIIFISEAKNITRPVVRMIDTEEIISLENETDLFVSEIIGT